MEGSLIYLITVGAVVGVVLTILFGYALAKGGLGTALAMLMLGIAVSFLLMLPGMIWQTHQQQAQEVRSIFAKVIDGNHLSWQRDEDKTWSVKVHWIDAEGKYRISIIVVNPWAEPTILEE